MTGPAVSLLSTEKTDRIKYQRQLFDNDIKSEKSGRRDPSTRSNEKQVPSYLIFLFSVVITFYFRSGILPSSHFTQCEKSDTVQ
jgi:hypothetical protein